MKYTFQSLMTCDPESWRRDRLSTCHLSAKRGGYLNLKFRNRWVFFLLSNLFTISPYTGNKCSPGHYCEQGSGAETDCPPGSYLPSEGAKNDTYCLDCLSGMFCNESGLAQPQGNCSAGKCRTSVMMSVLGQTKSIVL